MTATATSPSRRSRSIQNGIPSNEGGQFLDAQGVGDKLLFLTADRPTLESVWGAYYIGVTRVPVTGPAAERNRAAYSVAHNDVLYLIDKRGADADYEDRGVTGRNPLANQLHQLEQARREDQRRSEQKGESRTIDPSKARSQGRRQRDARPRDSRRQR